MVAASWTISSEEDGRLHPGRDNSRPDPARDTSVARCAAGGPPKAEPRRLDHRKAQFGSAGAGAQGRRRGCCRGLPCCRRRQLSRAACQRDRCWSRIDGETLTLVSTDRYRLAVRELRWNPARLRDTWLRSAATGWQLRSRSCRRADLCRCLAARARSKPSSDSACDEWPSAWRAHRALAWRAHPGDTGLGLPSTRRAPRPRPDDRSTLRSPMRPCLRSAAIGILGTQLRCWYAPSRPDRPTSGVVSASLSQARAQ